MKTLFKTFIFSLLAISTFAQQASEIDPKFVKLPRYANLTAITTAIGTPTQGMMVYNISTASNWYYNGSAWANTAGSLALPFSQSLSAGSPLFSLFNTGAGEVVAGVNSGTGIAANFQINNPANNSRAIYATTDGGGVAIEASNFGTGGAGYFQVGNATNATDVLTSITSGTGRAGNFRIQNVLNSDDALISTTNGLGLAGNFEINNATNASRALVAITNGIGEAAYFQGTNALETNGTIKFGGSGVGTITAGKVLTATNGSGNATWQAIPTVVAPLNLTSATTTFQALATGLSGNSGNFEVTNASNTANAISATTIGTGKAAYFQGTNALETNGTIKFGGSGVGTPAAGKVLTGTDGLGNATWQAIPAVVAPLSLTFSATTLLSIATGASGNAGDFQITNPGSNANTISASTNGTGNALNADNTGSGKAGEFLISAPTNGAATVTATNNGIGRAIIAQIGNGTNSSTALLATSNGTGRAIDANNTSSTQPTISVVNGTNLGPALEITGGIKVSGINKAAFKIVTSAPFIAANKFDIENTTFANASNDILTVTYEHTGGAYLLINKTFATSWNGGNWEIHLTDGTTMPVGVTFNVLVIKQ